MKENVRKQGILLPVSSIPSAYGIGTFGRESYRFVDFLEKSGNRLWQILPLGPTGYGDSPYQSFSTFAGNPYYIDLELLIERIQKIQQELPEHADIPSEEEAAFLEGAEEQYEALRAQERRRLHMRIK